jgi:hypothetical protein
MDGQRISGCGNGKKIIVTNLDRTLKVGYNNVHQQTVKELK